MNEKNSKTNYEVKVTKWYFDYVTYEKDKDTGELTPYHRPYYVKVVEDPFIGDTWVYKTTGTNHTFYGTYS